MPHEVPMVSSYYLNCTGISIEYQDNSLPLWCVSDISSQVVFGCDQYMIEVVISSLFPLHKIYHAPTYSGSILNIILLS